MKNCKFHLHMNKYNFVDKKCLFPTFYSITLSSIKCSVSRQNEIVIKKTSSNSSIN